MPEGACQTALTQLLSSVFIPLCQLQIVGPILVMSILYTW